MGRPGRRPRRAVTHLGLLSTCTSSYFRKQASPASRVDQGAAFRQSRDSRLWLRCGHAPVCARGRAGSGLRHCDNCPMEGALVPERGRAFGWSQSSAAAHAAIFVRGGRCA